VAHTQPDEKPLHWIGSSRDDVCAFPGDVRVIVGFALLQAELGGKHIDAKPLKGFGGASMLEIITDYDGGAYQTDYTVKFRSAIYVLHAFQEKSKRELRRLRRNWTK
jgi:phage-related protein